MGTGIRQDGFGIKPFPCRVFWVVKSARRERVSWIEFIIGDIFFCVCIDFIYAGFFEFPEGLDVGLDYFGCGLFVLIIDL